LAASIASNVTAGVWPDCIFIPRLNAGDSYKYRQKALMHSSDTNREVKEHIISEAVLRTSV